MFSVTEGATRHYELFTVQRIVSLKNLIRSYINTFYADIPGKYVSTDVCKSKRTFINDLSLFSLIFLPEVVGFKNTGQV